jgi:biopolymer transport protein ExbD
MTSKRNVPSVGGVTEINLTPMIDVVFQLIIFFMCAMKFKTLDNKLELIIPTDRGDDITTERIKEVVTVRVIMRQAASEGVPRISVFQQEIAPEVGLGAAPLPRTPRDADPATMRAAQVRHKAYWERNVTPKLAVLEEKLKVFVSRDKTLEYEIDAGPLVRHEYVVGVVDTFVAAGIDNVKFRGTRAPKPGQ